MKSLMLRAGMIGAALTAWATTAVAAPGDDAANQKRYMAIRGGARSLQNAIAALEKGDDIFKGHRVKAMKFIREALGELDEAVKFADANDKPGKKTEPRFEPERGKLASTQGKYLAIKGGANHVIQAGTALDTGFDKFGGHRVRALNFLNRALDELETAVKSAK